MKQAFLIILAIIGTILSSCASQNANPPIVGEVVGTLDSQTFQAEYKGQNLKVGDRIGILKYEDFETDLKDHQSKTLPQKRNKIMIGQGVISSVLKDDYYEFRSETPQYIPEGAFIEKL